MSEGKKVRWTIASARQNLPTLVDLAAREPQDIYRRDELVARVVRPDADNAQPRTLGPVFAELQRICTEENYSLEIPGRKTRPNAFARELARVPRKRTRKQR